MPEVEYAEPTWIYQHFANFTSNDPYFPTLLWGMSAGGINSVVQAATCLGLIINWKRKLSYIGIIDEGYNVNEHEDLAANAGVNPGGGGGNRRKWSWWWWNGLVDWCVWLGLRGHIAAYLNGNWRWRNGTPRKPGTIGGVGRKRKRSRWSGFGMWKLMGAKFRRKPRWHFS